VSDYPHTIDNGAGEELTFLGIRRDDGGDYLEIRNEVDPGAGPPMHVHLLQEEGMTVERGTLAYQASGEDEARAGPGSTAVFPPGVGHRFWNAGDDQLVVTGYVRPPDNLEYYLTQVYASMRRTGRKRPSAFDGAYLSHRYGSEFQVLNVPQPVQRVVFPIILAVGRLLGWDKRFSGAPEPVRRSPSGPA
jgi:quercetin dioxygenase-like cupin family protein